MGCAHDGLIIDSIRGVPAAEPNQHRPLAGEFRFHSLRPYVLILSPHAPYPPYNEMSQLPAVVQREKPRTATEESPPVVRIQKMIFEEAAAADASDIHIEPTQGATRVRYRINGILRESLEVPRWMHDNLVVRIKVLSKLDISERRLPQDGHITAEESQGLDVRVSILPTRWGEKIVIRMLRRGRSLMALAQLGFQSAVEERLHGLVRRPEGMLLAVGPTGSGKTTTLYALVNEIRREPMNIVTIEDPIEYEVDGVSQVPVSEKTGLTFSKALRSILRQDPDVILVGEIRDSDTAVTAFNAAMMGSINKASVRLLRAAGYDVIVPGRQICCGALANHAGLRDTAREMARTNIAAFVLDHIDAVIINAAGCGAMLKEYPLLIEGAERFSAKVKDIAEFLVSTRIAARLKKTVAGRVGYDDPC